MTTTCFSCTKSPQVDLKQIAEKIEEKAVEQNKTTEDKQEVIFNLLSELTEKQLQKLTLELSQDLEIHSEYAQLTAEQLKMKRDGVECVTCDQTSDDPNVRQ